MQGPFTEKNLFRNIYKEVLWKLKCVYAFIYERIFYLFSVVINKSNGVTPDGKSIQRILIVKSGRLGDFFILIPSLYMIRKGYPKAKITMIFQEEFAKFLLESRLIDEAIPYHGILQINKFLNKKSFDLAVVFYPPSFFLYLILFLHHIKYRVGYNLYNNGFLLTHPVEFRYLAQYEADNMQNIAMDILRKLGLAETFNSINFISQTHFSEKDKIDTLFKQHNLNKSDMIIGICPGSGRKPKFIDRLIGYVSFEKHVWPQDKFVQLSRWLIKIYNVKVVFIGTGNEKDYINSIINKVNHKNALNFAGTTINQLFHLINKIDLLVTNDTGPMHIAVLLKKPLVAIFGYSDPKAWGPKDDDFLYRIVQRNDFNCIPCQRFQSKTDYMCVNPLCINGLELTKVKEATQHILDKLIDKKKYNEHKN